MTLSATPKPPRFAVFAKHLQGFTLKECCQRVKAAGFDGLDLTVRPGGYVVPPPETTPGAFASALKEAVGVCRDHGLEVPLLTTGLIDADDPAAGVTIETAAAVGVREIKLHYWPWPPHQSLREATALARRQFAGLVDIARKNRVRLNIHNHSGDFVSHSVEVVARLLADHDPGVAGAYLDPAHATVEGGFAGWRAALETLAERVTLLAVKDPKWFEDPPGSVMPSQRRKWVPVGTGNVRWPAVLGSVAAMPRWTGWASIHGEYQGPNSFADLTCAQVLEQCVADRETIKAQWGRIFP